MRASNEVDSDYRFNDMSSQLLVVGPSSDVFSTSMKHCCKAVVFMMGNEIGFCTCTWGRLETAAHEARWPTQKRTIFVNTRTRGRSGQFLNHLLVGLSAR
jgi:hypothetical protein